MLPKSLSPKERNSGQIRFQDILVNGTPGIHTRMSVYGTGPMGGKEKRESTRSNQDERFEGDPGVIFCNTNCFAKKVCVLKHEDN